MEDDSKSEYEKIGPEQADLTSPLPLLPLRDVVVFPHMVIPLFVGRAKSIKAMEMSMEGGQHILLATQRNASQNRHSCFRTSNGAPSPRSHKSPVWPWPVE